MHDLRVGLCGFTMSMRTYAREFPVVEVQSTFYEPPSDASMRKWIDSTGPDLEYTMKVWQLVTHPAPSPTYRRMKRRLAPGDNPGFFRDSPSVEEGWRRSVECARLLGATAMLFQCPASFKPVADNFDRMRRFFESRDRPRARLLWEPRGKDWVTQRAVARELCRELGLVHVVDPFVTPPEPGGSVYWRLHGPGAHGPRTTSRNCGGCTACSWKPSHTVRHTYCSTTCRAWRCEALPGDREACTTVRSML